MSADFTLDAVSQNYNLKLTPQKFLYTAPMKLKILNRHEVLQL